jgi:hypothetical protein
MIMDVALAHNFTHQHRHQINNCRLYPQVLMLSDIRSADGNTILPEILHGHRILDKQSSLLWPSSHRPTDWAAWHTLLQHITTGMTLKTSLCAWIPYRINSGNGYSTQKQIPSIISPHPTLHGQCTTNYTRLATLAGDTLSFMAIQQLVMNPLENLFGLRW